MSKKTKTQNKTIKEVQIFSSLVQMKFKPTNEKGVQSSNKKKQKLIQNKKEVTEIYDPLSMVLMADHRRLKFVASLSADHFIIGNQNQIDMISFGSIAHGFVDTEYYWSLILKGPIQSVTVDAKKSIFLILSENIIFFYRYNVKTKDLPVVIAEIPTKEGVRFVRFLKDILLGIFYNGFYEIYNVQNLALIKKKLLKKFDIGDQKHLLTIPPSIDNIINVFFEQTKQNKQSFILWCLQINFEGQQIRTRQPYRVYDIMNYVKGKLSIQNYTRDIIFMNLNHQIMAIKNGYLIDTVNVSVNQQGQILKYIHPQTILHITKKNVQVYNFSINMAVKPEKIVLKSMDSIELKSIPQGAFYISVLQTVNSNFAIFFEDSERKRNQTRGEISYYFEVSQATSLKNKINSIFQSISLGVSNPEIVEEKYNMAKKMGLTEKQIYLQIWNRSNRCSLEDFQYILATRDYKTIKHQIQKKLKKQSMVLRQILRIEEGCFEINRQKIQSSTCNQQDFQDFLTSHFLMRKLKLYREINVLQRLSSIVLSDDTSNEGKSLKIDIQQYYLFKNSDIKGYLVQQISDMLFNFKNNAKIIRIIIKQFKFAYRMIYKQILQQIIVASKEQLMNLLNEIPQILPYIHPDLNEEQLKEGLYDGIWGDIHPEEWENCLYPQKIQTIHNREILQQFQNSLWFKRYWLTSHDMPNKTKQEIQEINSQNNSQKIFFFFISKLYEYTKNNKPLYYQMVNFLQQKYELFPVHLKGKALLYQNLYIYYYSEEKNNPSGRLNFAQFLEMDDEHLFKYYFDHQKVKKNSLLKEVKPIYEQSDANGSHIFNIGLFSYFYSDLSAISDLKFILNRINNQKTQFHQKNFGIYQVLVKSMQLKLRLGGKNDIPMDQVMIYIQNIPLDRSNHIMEQLAIMESINAESARFIQMNINMSVKEIMDNSDIVLCKIIQHQIRKKKILDLSNWDQFRNQTFILLKECEKVRGKLYNSQESNFTLMVYLSSILESQGMIQKAARLLQDEQLHDLYNVDQKSIENIVLYMYKWSFSRSSKYPDNEVYLKKLLELLPHENDCRKYLQTELQLGMLLSSKDQPLQYPLSQTSTCPSIKDLQQIFCFLKKDFILKLDLQRLFTYVNLMQHMVYAQTIKAGQFVTLHKIYELVILQLLQKQYYKQVISYIYKILQLQSPIKNVGILYIILFIYKIADQFNEESRKYIFKLLAIYFFEPLQILKVIDFVIKTKLTGLEQTKYLKGIFEREWPNRLNFTSSNPVYSQQFRNSKKQTSKIVIQNYRSHIKTKKQEFERHNEYDLAFSIFCNQPYLLTKFVDLLKPHLNLKSLKAFLLLTANRDIFNPVRVFQMLKRIYAILMVVCRDEKEIDHLLVVFQSKAIEQEFQVPKLGDYDIKLHKATTQFSKITTFHKRRSTSDKKEQITQKRVDRIREIMQNPGIALHEHLELDESEDQKEQSTIIKEPTGIKQRVKVAQIQFDTINQRKHILGRILPFRQFILGKGFLTNTQPKLVKNPSVKIPQKIRLLSSKDNNYLAIRNSMIEHLYSHKVVSGSECGGDEQARKEDEDFLDSFLPNNHMSMSGSRASPRDSKLSNRSSKMREMDQKQQTNLLVKVVDNQLLVVHGVQSASYSNTGAHDNQGEGNRMLTLKQNLVKTFNQIHVPKFQISALQKELKKMQEGKDEDQSKTKKRRQDFLVKFIKYLYYQPIETVGLNLKLIEDIARKHAEAGVNIFFLQAYQRIYGTHDKYGLEMDISALLPISGVFVKSKDIFDLYKLVEPHITKRITQENLFKLSKLIALGFRKNVVEQQILFNYLKVLAKEYIHGPEQELNKLFQKIRSLLQKLTVQVLVQRGQDLFKQLQSSEGRSRLLQMYMQSMKNKGYLSAARALAAKVGE